LNAVLRQDLPTSPSAGRWWTWPHRGPAAAAKRWTADVWRLL